ncbi:MAG: uracil phosphoribosyltransferase [Candidatus Latescibacteria bacterium]|nr:uracil phosphoribosyltransferase [Candidatus Latescibacterota bacterium]
MDSLTVVDHPLVHHKLSLLRSRDCDSGSFRQLLRETTLLLAHPATADVPLTTCPIETPMAPMQAPHIDQSLIAVVSVLRAGNGMLDALLELLPGVGVGHIGLARHHQTLEAEQYYCNLPPNLDQRRVFVVDPMLATGHSARAALDLLKEQGATTLRLLCLLAAPEGIDHLRRHHPDVEIITAAVDQCLNDKGYIVPGLGDAGDRLYNT